MGELKYRDLFRFFGALTILILGDLLFYAAFDLPKNTDAEMQLFALGFVLLCAIRERQPNPTDEEKADG